MKKLQKIHIHQQGFSLLESLLALFVLTIGLLGVAGMHSQSMSTGYVAVQRMAAVNKGEELFERIRANPAGLAAYAAGVAASNACTSTAICTPTEMAQDDLYIWNLEVDAAFPGTPTKTVAVTALPLASDPTGNVRQVSVTLVWTSKGDSHTYTAVTEVAP